jgi:hypothetical protein
VFEVEPDEIEPEFAVELHERRAVRVLQYAEDDAVPVERGREVVGRP